MKILLKSHPLLYPNIAGTSDKITWQFIETEVNPIVAKIYWNNVLLSSQTVSPNQEFYLLHGNSRGEYWCQYENITSPSTFIMDLPTPIPESDIDEYGATAGYGLLTYKGDRHNTRKISVTGLIQQYSDSLISNGTFTKIYEPVTPIDPFRLPTISTIGIIEQYKGTLING